MTYYYGNTNQHDALYNLARRYPGSVEALAVIMGKEPDTLRKKLRPGITTHHTNFEEVSELIEKCEEAHVVDPFAPLHAFCWRHGHVAFQLPQAEQNPDDLLKQLVDVMSVDGVLATKLNAALATNNDINDREFDEIDLSLMDCIMALVVLREKVIRKHEDDMQSKRVRTATSNR